MKLTSLQEDYLVWFLKQGGEGIIDRYGRVVAGGVPRHPASSVTFLRLVAWGMVEGIGDGQLYLTAKGRQRAAAIDGDRQEAAAKSRDTLQAMVEAWDVYELSGDTKGR